MPLRLGRRPMRAPAAPAPAAATASAPGSWDSPQRAGVLRAPASPACAPPHPSAECCRGWCELLAQCLRER